jgi:phosphoglycerate dehydrogenase-like enzyme
MIRTKNQGEVHVLKGLYLLDKKHYEDIYPLNVRNEIEALLGSEVPYLTQDANSDNLFLLKEADILFSGWGSVRMDQKFLDSVPKLKAVFYGAGSIKAIVTDDFWEKKARGTTFRIKTNRSESYRCSSHTRP